MSVRWSSRVWDHSSQAAGTLLVQLALADFANDEGESWPTVESLAQKARLSPRQVERALTALVDAGELVRPTGARSARKPYQLAANPTNCRTDTHVGSDPTSATNDPTPTSGAHVEPSVKNRQEPPTTLPGTDNRRELIEAWARIFEKPRATFSPSRMRAADRAFAEEPDLATLVKAIEGAKNYWGEKGIAKDFTDIFGTFRGTGDLASRIAFFVEQAGVTQVASSLPEELKNIPSAGREMVRQRQAHVEAWLKNPGDDRIRDRGERAAAWLLGQFSLVAHATQVGDVVVVEWQRRTT